jgi:glycosyltransferase involved in cell wall biosynthesis
MKPVAIICGAGIVSGKEIMALELGEGLREAGAEVHFVTSRWGSGEFSRRSEAAGFSTTRLWLGFVSATLSLNCLAMTADQLRRWPSLLLGYRRFLKAVKPAQVIHTNWHHVLLFWPLLRPRRDLFWLHEVMPNKPQYRQFFRWLRSRVGCFVAVSRAVGESLTNLGVPEDKIRIIYNGINDPGCDCSRGNSDGALTIGIVGQIGPWKGHEDLLEAFQRVIAEHPTAQLHIFGRGSPDYEALLRRRASEMGLEEHLTWHGFVKEAAQIYSSIKLLVVPSRFEEPFGLTAVEAGFFCLPVVASRRGGLSEIVENGVTGYLFEAGNVDELAQHLISLLTSDEARKRMGQNARDRVMSLFSQSRFVQEFCQTLQLVNFQSR